MRPLVSWAGLTGLVLLPSMAAAGGPEVPVFEPAPAPAPVFVPAAPMADWTGPYAGAQIGVAQVDDGVDDYSATTYGVHFGYLQDLGDFVLGGELEYDILDLEDAAGVDSANALRLKLRAGYDAGQVLPYVTLGAANVTIDPGAGSLEDTVGMFGLGADFQVSDRFRVGAEAQFHRTDDFDSAGELSVDGLALRGSVNF